MNHPAFILMAAFLIDCSIGDPNYSWHPVRLFGKLISWLELYVRKNKTDLQKASFLLPLAALAIVISAYFLLHDALGSLGWLLNLYLLYALIALKDLLEHGKRVELALYADSLDHARKKVQMMVGRNAATLDAHGVARATIESMAENLVDGFIAPVFWFTIATLVSGSITEGIAAILGFKVISTLDSMVGYKNEKYRILGSISARLDDVLNFLPARLSIPLISLASHILMQNGPDAWNIGMRDRLNHDSPNSAHAEATVAGALGLRLGGPAEYHGSVVEKPWIGNGRSAATAEDIQQARKLILWSGGITIFLAAILLIISTMKY